MKQNSTLAFGIFRGIQIVGFPLVVVGITFVPTDFEREDWFQQLVVAGFESTRRAFFLWEGVTPDLSREAVESTLRIRAGDGTRATQARLCHGDCAPLEDRYSKLRIV